MFGACGGGIQDGCVEWGIAHFQEVFLPCLGALEADILKGSQNDRILGLIREVFWPCLGALEAVIF